MRTLVQRELTAALGRYDALLCPAAPTPAYRLGEKSADPLAMYKGEESGVGVWVGVLRNLGGRGAGRGAGGTKEFAGWNVNRMCLCPPAPLPRPSLWPITTISIHPLQAT